MVALDSLRFTWSVMWLAGRAPGIYANLYLARRRACNVFRRQLVACGVDKSSAKELARCYPKIDQIVKGLE
jgi:hypothetical protein